MLSPQEVYRRMFLTLRVEHLRELCARHQLDTHGNANTLIERLHVTVKIEDLIALQPSVVPALKEIKGTDIFWLGQPCDVKTTFLPAAWTDQGKTIDDATEHPDELARWLYEHQGAERFGYEIRLFIIVADRKNPADSWKLKRDFDLIQKKFTDFFANTKAYRSVSFRFHQRQYSTFYQMLFIVR